MLITTAPLRLRFATLLMLSSATCGLVAVPQTQDKSPVRVLQRAPAQILKACTNEVPDLSRSNLESVRAVVAKYDLVLGTTDWQPNAAPKGTIVGQSLQPGSRVRCGTTLSITASSGPRQRDDAKVPVDPPDVVRCAAPDLTNHLLDDVQSPLGKRTWSIGRIDRTESKARPRTILEQSPRPRDPMKCGGTIDVLIAGPIQVPPPPAPCTVPDLAAADLSSARRALADKQLQLGRVSRENSARTPGTVLGQRPAADLTVRCGSSVDVLIAVPLPPVYVPALQGQDTGSARRTLDSAMLTLGTVEHRFADATAGVVIDQQPAVDTPVQRGSSVNIMVSDGPALRPIPKVIGLSRAAAAEILAAARFRLGAAIDRPIDAPLGRIVDQQPAAGSPAPPDTIVQVWVAVPMPALPPRPDTTLPADAAPPPDTTPTPAPAAPVATTDRGRDNSATAAPEQPSVPANPKPATVPQDRAEAPREPDNAPAQPAAPLVAIPNVVGLSAARAADALRAAGFAASTLGTVRSFSTAGTVTLQLPAAGEPAAPGTQVALVMAVPAIPPLLWVLLGIIGGAAAVLIARMLKSVRGVLPPSLRFEPHPDTNIAVTLSADSPLVRTELWLKPCPDAGVQTLQGAAPFGMVEIPEVR